MNALLLAAWAIVAAQPEFEPTSSYTPQTIEGWTVLVHKKLLEEKKELGEKTLKLLGARLYDITRVVPAPAVEKLRKVRFWVEENPKVACACYHPSRGWLAGHGFNPEKEKSVEIGGPTNFLGWAECQPNMVLHELAHAYHHQVLGYDHPDIKAAFKRAVESKSYESVLYYGGGKKRAYALNNDQEYFAELTESYFGTNDFYPFVRPEVKEHDPEMLKVLKKLWGL
jgi:hypothetical protein